VAERVEQPEERNDEKRPRSTPGSGHIEVQRAGDDKWKRVVFEPKNVGPDGKPFVTYDEEGEATVHSGEGGTVEVVFPEPARRPASPEEWEALRRSTEEDES